MESSQSPQKKENQGLKKTKTMAEAMFGDENEEADVDQIDISMMN